MADARNRASRGTMGRPIEPSAAASSAVGRPPNAKGRPYPTNWQMWYRRDRHGEEEAFSLRFGPVRKLTLSAGLLLHFTSGAIKGHARSAASAMSRQLDRQASA
jgi:hypothetical protein